MTKTIIKTADEIERENGGATGFHSVLIRVYRNGKMHASLASGQILKGVTISAGHAMVARGEATTPDIVAGDIAEMAMMLGAVINNGPANFRTRGQIAAKLAELEAEHAAFVNEDPGVARAINAMYANRIAGLRYALGEDTLPTNAGGALQ